MPDTPAEEVKEEKEEDGPLIVDKKDIVNAESPDGIDLGGDDSGVQMGFGASTTMGGVRTQSHGINDN